MLLATVAQPLLPSAEYSHTGVMVPVPFARVEVRFTLPPEQMVVLAVGALNVGSATTVTTLQLLAHVDTPQSGEPVGSTITA
jgi:phosphatidylserine decarboxylase